MVVLLEDSGLVQGDSREVLNPAGSETGCGSHWEVFLCLDNASGFHEALIFSPC